MSAMPFSFPIKQNPVFKQGCADTIWSTISGQGAKDLMLIASLKKALEKQNKMILFTHSSLLFHRKIMIMKQVKEQQS